MGLTGKLLRLPNGKIYRNPITGKGRRFASEDACADCGCDECGINCATLPTGLFVTVTRDGIAYEGTVVGGPNCLWVGTVFALDESGQIEVSVIRTEDVCGFTITFDPIGGSSAVRITPIGNFPDATEGFAYTGITVT